VPCGRPFSLFTALVQLSGSPHAETVVVSSLAQ